MPLTSDPATLTRSLATVAPEVGRYIRRTLADERMGGELVLVGHSQGAMLALEMALQGALVVRQVVAIAGMLPEAVDIRFSGKTVTGPEFVFVHGERDELIPVAKASEADRQLTERCFRSRLHVLAGHGHALSRGLARDALALATDGQR